MEQIFMCTEDMRLWVFLQFANTALWRGDLLRQEEGLESTGRWETAFLFLSPS